MVSLTFHGGVDEIGGNKVLYETDDGAVLLDFGRRMGMTGEYYSEFLQIRSKNALRDLIRLGVLPKIDGVYDPLFVDTTTLLRDPADRSKLPLDEAPDYWKREDIKPYHPSQSRVDGVFISHAHFDHIQDVSFLSESIPVICTEETRILSKAVCDVSNTGVDQQFYELRRREEIAPKRENYRTLFPGELDYTPVKEDSVPDELDKKTGFTFSHTFSSRHREYQTVMEGDLKGIHYRLIPVGHSVPGACSVLLTREGAPTVLYTGDVRFNGATGATIDQYVESIGVQVDVLITEGTRIDNDSIITEKQVQEGIISDIKDAEGLVLIDFGWKDISRFGVIYEAARANGRTFVINPKTAYLLYEMHVNFPDRYPDPREMENLRVYLKREGSLLYSKADYAKFKMGYLHHHGKNSAMKDRNIVRIAERMGIGGKLDNKRTPLPEPVPGEPYEYQEVYELATHHITHGLKAYEIRKHPEKYALAFSYWDSNELFDLIPEEGYSSAKYIKASTEPFNDEMMIDESKFMNWLDLFGVRYIKEGKMFQRRHISGHASQPELVEMITKLNPGKIIPVHTLNPEKFEELFPERVIRVKHGDTLKI